MSDILEPLLHPSLSAQVAKPRIAIVSTYDELCGIAGYTIALKSQLESVFEVAVFELDQYLLRNPSPKVRAIADNHIQQICEKLKLFPVVNMQLEYGTLGRNNADIARRLKMILNSAPSLIVTFHTVFGIVRFLRQRVP